MIANTADDIEIYGAYVSPDPDLVTFWLADRIDERGWGLREDTFQVMDGLRELGSKSGFSLGDRDLAIGIERARRLDEGERLTEAQAEIVRRSASSARDADERPAGAHPRAVSRALVAVAGVPDPPRGRGAGRRVSRPSRGGGDARGA